MRAKVSRFLTRDKDKARLQMFAEGVGHVLQHFQASNLSVWWILADPVLYLGCRNCLCLSTISQG